ncbi:MAG: YfhO family protein [Patescibacteria group bacterium]
MKKLMLKKFFLRNWFLFALILLVFIFFWKFFLGGLLPIPADIIVGLYYPWLDYKWGYAVGVPVKNPLLSDIPSLLYPWRSFVIDQLQIGQLPLWNPFYFGGMPLLANFQSAVFSYVNIFFLFLPKALAWSAGIIIQPFLTVFLIYLFLRNRNFEKISSLFGGVVFAFSGFFIAWMEYNVHGHTSLFLPLLLFLIDKYFSTNENRWLFLWSIFAAFQIFTGYIPIVIYSYLIIGLFIVYFYGFKVVSAKGGQLIKLAIFWFLGLSLAAVQLLPGIELLKLSIREVDPIVKASNAGFLPFSHLVTILAPDFFGNPATGNWWGQAFYDNFYFYAGTATIILVLLAVFSAKIDKFARFWVFLLTISLVMVLKNPIGEFLQSILGLKGGVAARALFITDFSLAMLAAVGMETILREKRKIAKHLFLATLLVGMSLVGLGIATLSITDPAHKLVAQRNLIIPGGVFFLSLPLLFFSVFSRREILRSFSVFLFFCLVPLNLLYSTQKYLPFSKPEQVFPTTPVIEFLQKQEKSFRFEPADVIPQNFWMPYGLETISGSDALLPKRMGEFLTAMETGKIQKDISRVHLLKNYDSPLFLLLNIKYILAKKITKEGKYDPSGEPPPRFQEKRYKLVFEDKTVQVWQDSKALPRAFWVHDFEVITEDGAIIKKLLASDFDVSRKLILEENPNFIPPEKKARQDKVEWLEYKPGKLKLVVESDQPGFVFLGNNFYPGWKGLVDNKESKIYRTNYTFQAVYVSGGKHEVKFIYEPESFRIGLKMSVIALALLFGLSGWILVKRRNWW